MRLRLECDVDSQSVCDEIRKIELENGHVLTLYPDASGILHRMTIEASTSEYETSTSSVPERKMLKVIFKIDEQLKHQLLDDLRFVESALCMYGVHEVRWRNARVSLVPENQQEREGQQVSSSTGKHRYEDSPKPLKTHLLRGCFRPLTVPLMFFREGEVFYRHFRYTSSFRSFYYILEGFYAAGSYRKEERVFKANQELVDAVRGALDKLAGGDNEVRIYGLLNRYRKAHTPEEVLGLLVLLRHKIQHYFHLAKGQRLAEGEASEDFRSAALLAMLVSIEVLWKKVDILQRMHRKESSADEQPS